MTQDERWLASQWPFVRAALPTPPARVIEIGCGRLGGFVPMLTGAGYDALGIDPEAPDGREYRRIEFERHEPRHPVDAVVACTALHHVTDVAEVIDRASSALVPRGAMVVVEWAWERFDEPTAQWCFARLPASVAESEPGWLHRRRAEWVASGLAWDDYCCTWATEDRVHQGTEILGNLNACLERRSEAHGPYFFPDLADTTEADEQTAIDTGQIQPTRIQYAGRLR